MMMDRPRSIRWFEQCYFGAIALSALSLVIFWPQLMPALAASPGMERLGEGAMKTIIAVSILTAALVILLLWYFVARRGSTVARWLTVLFLAYAIYSTATGLMSGGTPSTLATICSGLSLLLEIVAVAMLFMPDARGWFAQGTRGRMR